MKIIRPQTIAETTEFSRASTATYYDADGVLQTAAIDEPRLSYDPSDLTLAPIWLFEDAATNSILYSEDFSNVAWSKNNVTLGVSITAPDGNATMDEVIETTASSVHDLRSSNISVVSGQVVPLRIFAKKGSAYILQITLTGISSHAYANFDLDAGEIVSSGNSPVSFDITALPNDIYLCEIEITANVSGNVTGSFNFTNNNPTASRLPSYAGNTSQNMYLWGAHNNDGSYIPTTTIAVTRAADIPGDMLTSSVPEDDYDEYDAGDTYALGDRVISTTTHRIYESLQAGNLGNPLPAADEVSTEWWLNVSATNRWKMFDNSITSQTTAADVLATAIQTVGRVDSVAILNASARTARIIMEDATAGVVYDETYSLIDDSGITDYYEYFFEEVTRVPNYSVQDLPLYANTQVSVILQDEGATVLCGALVVGLSRTFGSTQLGASLGIQDYSVKITDDFGNRTILERSFNDTQSIQVFVENANLDYLKKLLAEFRATPIVYIGSDSYGSMIIYGFYKDFSFVITYTDHSILNIEIEGLT
jgi:hypothetical protein